MGSFYFSLSNSILSSSLELSDICIWMCEINYFGRIYSNGNSGHGSLKNSICAVRYKFYRLLSPESLIYENIWFNVKHFVALKSKLACEGWLFYLSPQNLIYVRTNGEIIRDNQIINLLKNISEQLKELINVEKDIRKLLQEKSTGREDSPV